MADIVKWNPFNEMMRMRDDFNRFFGALSPWDEQNKGGWAPSWGWSGWGPSIDVHETDDTVHVSVEIPGVNPDELDLTIGDDSFSISGEVKHEAETSKHGYRQMERRYGSFHRTIPLPTTVQHAKAIAEYKNGILHVTIPKAEPGRSRFTRLKVGDKPNDQLQH